MGGKLLDELPRVKASGIHYDWDASARLARDNPGKVVLAAKHVKDSKVKAVRQYTRSPFITDEGRIRVSVRDSAVENDGVRYGDVYFQWEPKDSTEEGQ